MKNICNLFIGIGMLIFSCDNPNTQIKDAEEQTLSSAIADISKLNDALKKFEEPSQNFKVGTNKPSIITGRKGTKIAINPNDLIRESGNSLGKNIEVELKELTNQTDLLCANAQSVSDGKLLISGGAYYIGMTSNGENLKLKEGKTLNVQFPKISNKEMELFYGERNDLGQMNWINTNENFKVIEKVQIKSESVKSVNKTKRKSEIDAILDYVETGDTTTTAEGRARAVEWEKENKIQQQKAEEELKKQQREFELNQNLYDDIGIIKLGWINCDRFLNAESETDMIVSINPENRLQSANIYLIFKEINSVAQGYFFSDKEFQYKYLPIGYKARLIAYSIKDEKVYAFSTDLTIIKNQKLSILLKETNEKDFKKLFKD